MLLVWDIDGLVSGDFEVKVFEDCVLFFGCYVDVVELRVQCWIVGQSL